MDNLTHSLVGVFLSRAGLNRLTPHATSILLISANAPDIDVISGIGGAAELLRWHRGVTHSLIFSLVLAVASVALVRAFTRSRAGWLAAIAAAWVGVLSHLLLDLTNNYGVRLLEPFSHQWFEWNLTYVIDPYIWAALIIAFVAPLLGRLLSSEMGTRKHVYPSRSWAVLALSFVLLFNCARLILHTRAIATLNARLYNNEVPRRVAAFPTPLNPMQWQALTELSDRYYLDMLDLNSEFRPGSGRLLYKNDPGPALPVLRARKEFGGFIAFDQYPLWRVTDGSGNSRYHLTDLRFGDPVQQTFTCSARLTGNKVADEQCDLTFAPNFGER